MKDSGSLPRATKAEVLVEAVVILGAGSDTTAHVIQGILGDPYYASGYRSELQREIDQAYQDLSLANRGTEISYNDATMLPYLAAVIKESMRLSPSFVYQMPRETPAEGLDMGAVPSTEGPVCGHQSTCGESLKGDLRRRCR